jgi:hypothetical protein
MADPKTQSTAPTPSPAKPNLPNHRDPFTKHYVDQVRKAVKYRDGDTEDPIKINEVCPVKGCGYPIVERILVGGKLAVKPATWEHEYLRVCLWDAGHHRETVNPLEAAPPAEE